MDKNITEYIRERVSTFPINFTGEKISSATINELLDTAVWAPTHKQTEPWRFIVYQNEGVKAFFNKQAEIYQDITPSEKVNAFKLKKYSDKAELVSHVIVLIAEHDANDSIPEIEEIVATGCVVQNIYLMLASYGIGGYLSTGNLCYAAQMRDYLKVEKDEKVIGFFQLGIPKSGMKSYPRKRIAAKDKTVWVG